MRKKKKILTALLLISLVRSSYSDMFSGTVYNDENKPLSNVQVTVPALQKGVLTDSSGTFHIDLPPGNYAMGFHRLGYADHSETIFVPSPVPVKVTLSESALAAQPITISAEPTPSPVLTTPANVTVLQGHQLEQKARENVMDAIKNEPGVNMITVGPSVSKPSVDGLNSEDLVIVEDGVRSESLAWGEEHAPEIDTLTADRIEVLRGAATLMYGSDALGGVISVNKAPLPSAALGAGPLSGKIVTDVESVNQSAAEGVVLQGAQGDWGWRSDLSEHQAGNIYTPNGTIANTASKEVNGSGEIGVTKDWGDLTMDYSHFTKHLQLDESATQTDNEFQDLAHDNGNIHADIKTDGLFNYEVTAGYDRVDREEYNGYVNSNSGIVGGFPTPPSLEANWIETSYTVNIKAHQKQIGPFQGTFGFTSDNKNELAGGIDQLIPSTNWNEYGEYAYEEAHFGSVKLTAGIRGDENQLNADSYQSANMTSNAALAAANGLSSIQAQTRNYEALTGALGGVWHIIKPLAFAVNVGRGYRNPDEFELFAFGEHEGTGQFAVGDPNLQPETSMDSDASLRWVSSHFRSNVDYFYNHINNYIYAQPTNLNATDVYTGNTLPVFQTTQGNSILQGATVRLDEDALQWLELKEGYDHIRAENISTGQSIPFIPADRFLLSFKIHKKKLGDFYHPYFGANTHIVLAQNQPGPPSTKNLIDTPTGGYTIFGLSFGWRILVMQNPLSFDFGADNLLNKAYADSMSVYDKQFGFVEPGRNLYMKISVPFGS
jgi:iron complex outermembrane receptor protein